MTALDEIRGHEDPANGKRWQDVDWKRNFGGENWADRRRQAAAFAGRDPAVLVVGAAQAGLMIAARLSLLGIDTLVVDREQRVGNSWRRRYHALTLHNETRVNHFPYMAFPRSWPVFIPKDMLANWFELYSEAMELNVWTGTELVAADYDDADEAMDRHAQAKRRERPRHAPRGTSCSATASAPLPNRRSCRASTSSRASCAIPATMAADSTGRGSGRWCWAPARRVTMWRRISPCQVRTFR